MQQTKPHTMVSGYSHLSNLSLTANLEKPLTLALAHRR